MTGCQLLHGDVTGNPSLDTPRGARGPDWRSHCLTADPRTLFGMLDPNGRRGAEFRIKDLVAGLDAAAVAARGGRPAVNPRRNARLSTPP